MKRYHSFLAKLLCVIALQCTTSHEEAFMRDIQSRVNDPDPYKRQTAIWILSRSENIKQYLSLKCMPIIAPLFTDKKPDVRNSAYGHVGLFFLVPPKTYYENGVKIIHGYKIINPKRLDENEDYRQAVKTILPLLLKGIHDDDEFIKLQSIFAIGCIGPLAKESIPVLLNMLKDRDKMIRRRAIIALANISIKTDIVISNIQKLLVDDEAEVRDNAKQALEVLQK